MNRLDIFHCCKQQYHAIAFNKACIELDREGGKSHILQDFTAFVIYSARLAVNLSNYDMQEFLEENRLPTRIDIGQRYCRDYGILTEAQVIARSREYAIKRAVFDANIEDSVNIRYLAVTTLNRAMAMKFIAGAPWHCVTGLTYSDLPWKDSICFLKHNSLHPHRGYVPFDGTKFYFDGKKIIAESACWQDVHFMGALKFEASIMKIPCDKWEFLFPDPVDEEDWIEALTREKVPPSDFIVHVNAAHYNWYVNLDVDESTPPEIVTTVRSFFVVCELIKKLNIHMEQIHV